MNILFLDTETGGLNPWVNSLLQVGAVAYINDEVTDLLKFNIKLDTYNVTDRAMEINGLKFRDLRATGLTPAEGVETLNKFITKNFGDEKPILAGHNPSIDKYMLLVQLYEANNLSMDDFINHRMIDTMSLVWFCYDLGLLPKEACSGAGAFRHFGIYPELLHDALSDAADTVLLYKNLLALVRKSL